MSASLLAPVVNGVFQQSKVMRFFFGFHVDGWPCADSFVSLGLRCDLSVECILVIFAVSVVDVR